MIVNMKLRSTHDWSSVNKARELVGILIAENSYLLPEKYDQREPERLIFDISNLQQVDQIWTTNLGWLFLKRRKPYIAWMNIQKWFKETKQFNEITSGFDERYFKKEENISKLVDCAKKLYVWGTIAHGYMCHEKDWDIKNYFGTPTKIAEGKVTSTGGIWLQYGLPGIYWANYFGPVYVSFFGREKFLSVPAYYKEELPDGGYLLLVSKSPLDYGKQETRKLEQKIIDHLGRDAFFEKEHPQKLVRAPQFIFEQPSAGKVMESISYDPIIYTIPDINRFIQDAPNLADALVHRTTALLNYSPESLKLVDDYILKKSSNNPDPWTKEAGRLLLQELSAYYGEVLRRNLNGKWIIQEGSGGDAHPVVVFSISNRIQSEYPFARVSKLWLERVRADGLVGRYYLLESGQLNRVENLLNKMSEEEP